MRRADHVTGRSIRHSQPKQRRAIGSSANSRTPRGQEAKGAITAHSRHPKEVNKKDLE